MFSKLTIDELSELDLKLLKALGRVGNKYGTSSNFYQELDKLSDEVYGRYHGVLNHQMYEGIE